ncbi:CYTOCHROME P450 98A9 [Salix purpurea]|uniref:CYTOCHROME P450 98A9 n=1 Tax=Salix purpurea TaxID=77065 RepID=A0A9Q0THE5_SALPP|nr:CYTOCHROME P450 98A9 [Salix purpurea]
MEIFSPKRLDFYQDVRVEELHSLLKSLYKTSGTPFKAREKFSDLSLSVISRLVLGRNYTLESEKSKGVYTPHEFKKILDELFVLNGVLEIGDWIPWLSYFDLQGNIKKMKAVAKKVDRFIEHELEEHDARRNGVKNYVAKDMMDILLQLSDDPSLDVEFGRTGVKALTLDLIAGGTESTAVTAEWALAELLKKPEVFEKGNRRVRQSGRKREMG